MTFCSLGTKGYRFCSVLGSEWKEDLFWESQAQEIMGRPRRTIYIDRNTESLWQKDDALCLVGPEGRDLL